MIVKSNKAIVKFSYELKHRKRDFIKECLQYDLDLSSKISKVYFEIVLDKFTCYPKRQEKEEIINQLLINNSYVEYLKIADIKIQDENIVYNDPLLQHLNIIK